MRRCRRKDARLIARDDKKNPLISTFDWTEDATQRIFRVPAGFMRNQTQERVEELARERAAVCRAGLSTVAIDLALVEDGIEIGKKMMAEMIANYQAPGKSATAATVPAGPSAAGLGAPAEAPGTARNVVPAGNGKRLPQRGEPAVGSPSPGLILFLCRRERAEASEPRERGGHGAPASARLRPSSFGEVSP